jgi:hypothetical protein
MSHLLCLCLQQPDPFLSCFYRLCFAKFDGVDRFFVPLGLLR